MRIVIKNGFLINSMESLNPCFWGRYADRSLSWVFPILFRRLNPCFWGRYADRQDIASLISRCNTVLILVFGEDMRIVMWLFSWEDMDLVLILVFGEDMRIEEILQKIILQYIKYKKLTNIQFFGLNIVPFTYLRDYNNMSKTSLFCAS